MKPIQVGIVGARGYSGLELARILLKHPNATIAACFASSEGKTTWRLSDYLPEESAHQVPVLPIDQLKNSITGLEAVFLATPAETSAELAPLLAAHSVNTIDLSGAFRLENSVFEDWYGFRHPSPELLARAQYGLSPWMKPLERSPHSAIIANPGCYATSILMALLPLLNEKLIRPETLVIDAKSGTSGAGRKANENLLFTEVADDCLPYKVGKHQHLPEIVRHTQLLSGINIDPMFTTHLLPVRRGILSGLYARTTPGCSLERLQSAFDRAYSHYPLVKHGPISSSKHLSLRKVVGSARTHITYELKEDQLYLFSSVDNLLKGAASQAVENFNRLRDLPVITGLSHLEGTL